MSWTSVHVGSIGDMPLVHSADQAMGASENNKQSECVESPLSNCELTPLMKKQRKSCSYTGILRNDLWQLCKLSDVIGSFNSQSTIFVVGKNIDWLTGTSKYIFYERLATTKRRMTTSTAK